MKKSFISMVAMLSVGGFAQAQNKSANANNGAGDWTPAKCQEQVPAVKAFAQTCLKIKEQGSRQDCIKSADSKFPPGLFKSCGPVMDSVKNEMMANEKKLYPKQASAFDGAGNNGQMGAGPNTGPGGPNNNPGMNNGTPGGPGGPGNTGMNGAAPNAGPGGPNNGPGMNNGPKGGPTNNTNNNTNNNKNNFNPADWNDSKCQAQLPKLSKGAEACLSMKQESKRAKCFSRIGDQMPKGFFESCKSQTEPMKQAFMAKEKSAYPNQKSGLDGNDGQNSGPNNGPNGAPAANGTTAGGPNGGPGMNNAGSNTGNNSMNKNFDCGKLVAETKVKGMKCVAMKNVPQRKECGDKIGQGLKQTGGEQVCHDPINQLHQELINQEKQKWPEQESVL